jgi:hypothetical protein
MQRRIWLVGLVGVVGVLVTIGAVRAGTANPGSQGQAFACDARTLQGTYGIQLQGTRPVPPALGGGFESVIGVVIRTYDGFGTFTQVDNVKGFTTGIVPDREGFGEYVVNADCTAGAILQPGPGIVIEERMVIVQDGREIRSMTASPPPLMVTAVQKRIDRR